MARTFSRAGKGQSRRISEFVMRASCHAAHVSKLGRILSALDAAATPVELNQPGYKLHSLKGTLKGQWSVWVDGNCRVTFRFVGPEVELVEYQDYH